MGEEEARVSFGNNDLGISMEELGLKNFYRENKNKK